MKIQTSTSMIVSQTPCSARLLPSSRSHLQTKTTPTSQPIQQSQQPLGALYNHVISQTAAAVLIAGLALTSPSPALAADTATATATANSPNPFRAVAEFYKTRQQANGGAFFLGPVQLSRQRLESAAAAVQGTEQEKYTTALEAVRTASLDCIVFDFDFEGKKDLTTAPSSEQEYKFGDTCKYRLIVKNATTLTKDKDLVAETEAKMQLFIRQLQLLDDRLDRATQGDADAGGKSISELLDEALNTNIEFEETIKKCLGLAAEHTLMN